MGADGDAAVARTLAAVRAARWHYPWAAAIAGHATDDLGGALRRPRRAGDSRHQRPRVVRCLHVQPRAERDGWHVTDSEENPRFAHFRTGSAMSACAKSGR